VFILCFLAKFRILELVSPATVARFLAPEMYDLHKYDNHNSPFGLTTLKLRDSTNKPFKKCNNIKTPMYWYLLSRKSQEIKEA